MELTDDDVEGALYCVNEVISVRTMAGREVPQWMKELGSRFDAESLIAPWGHDTLCPRAQSESDVLLGSRQVADILGLSTRTVRHLAAEIGVEKIGGKLVFKLSAVDEYAKGRRNAQFE